jgi:hypothetical protein
VRTEVIESGRPHRRRFEAERDARHCGRQASDSRHWCVGASERIQCGERRTAQLLHLLLDALRCGHGSAAQPALDEIDAWSRDAGERRPQVREQVAAVAAEPREAQQR